MPRYRLANFSVPSWIPRRTEDQVVRNLESTTLWVGSVFLALVAVLLNSGALFYMGTALIGTLIACKVQAWLSVRYLRLERISPPSVQAGDLVTVQIAVWSERKIRRPLITVSDSLPPRMQALNRTESLPIAPAYDLPIMTQYQFRPMKRGKYRWDHLTAKGTDALGIGTTTKSYITEPAEMTVLPMPVPLSLELPYAAGWGISEAVSGNSRGAGMEPRGVREYVAGDSLRYVHWRSSARMGELLVKEFEAGSNAIAAFVLQRTKGTEVGMGVKTTIEAMCSHAAYMAETFLRQGARVEFPTLEIPQLGVANHERMAAILHLLASVECDQTASISEEITECARYLPPGSTVFAMLGIADHGLVGAADLLNARGSRIVALLYDAHMFLPKNKVLRAESAVNPSLLDELRQAGVFTAVVPTEAISR